MARFTIFYIDGFNRTIEAEDSQAAYIKARQPEPGGYNPEIQYIKPWEPSRMPEDELMEER